MDFDFSMNVDTLFNFNVLFFDNHDPDMRVIEMRYDVEIANLIEKEIGSNAVQTIMSNQDRHTKDRCPYFRVVATPPSENIAKNYKFEAFLRKIGQGNLITPRCSKVLVVGLHALNNLDSPISMPLAFCTTTIQDFAIDSLGVVDMACIKPLGAFNIQSSEDLVKISGMILPVHLPDNVQWKILSYCEAPTATIIKDAMQAICDKWDAALLPMFCQRDARIPPAIASAYNVPCVASTIVVATKPFLVPLA
jgi:hypothetical protein